jgi:tRNA-Thr(GGU) m(6)t(6)A37 methyltransferase TsaA
VDDVSHGHQEHAKSRGEGETRIRERGRPDLTDVYTLHPIGFIRSPLKTRADAPNQGSEDAPDAWLEVSPAVAQGFEGIQIGDEIIVVTWFHFARRDVLKLHPRWDERIPVTGVFNTRSPDRPNPLGLHRVRVREVAGCRLLVGPIEAIDGTPVVDVKPVLAGHEDS